MAHLPNAACDAENQEETDFRRQSQT